jgi:hypothetical protein
MIALLFISLFVAAIWVVGSIGGARFVSELHQRKAAFWEKAYREELLRGKQDLNGPLTPP